MKLIEHKVATISVIHEGMIMFAVKAEAYIELSDAIELYRLTKQIAQGKKYITLIDARGSHSISKEAREWSVKPELHTDHLAQAIVVNSLANRIIANFVIRYNKERIPMKLFSSLELAKYWLSENYAEFSENSLLSESAY